MQGEKSLLCFLKKKETFFDGTPNPKEKKKTRA